MKGKRPSKRIVSFNIEDRLISRLERYATTEHKGNKSAAIAWLIRHIPTTLEDYPNEEHTAPSQNYMDTGKCNPFYNGLAPCPTCWGSNVAVKWENGVVNGRHERVLTIKELEPKTEGSRFFEVKE